MAWTRFPKIKASPTLIALPEGAILAVTEKVDGENFSVHFDLELKTFGMYTRNNPLVKKILFSEAQDEASILSRVAKSNKRFVAPASKALKLFDTLMSICEKEFSDCRDVVFYFESYGGNIQRRIKYRNLEKESDIVLIQIGYRRNDKAFKFLSFDKLKEISSKYNISSVPLIATLLSIDKVSEFCESKFAELKENQSAEQTLAQEGDVEGFVFWPMNFEPERDKIDISNCVFKILSSDFKSKKSDGKVKGFKAKRINIVADFEGVDLENIIYDSLPDGTEVDKLTIKDCSWVIPRAFAELYSQHSDSFRVFDDEKETAEYDKKIRKLLAEVFKEILEKIKNSDKQSS